MERVRVLLLILVVTFGFSGVSNASLWDRGGGLIYDDFLDITWLQDANYGAGSDYDNGTDTADGRMTCDNAVAWADDLEYYDSVRDVTWDDWRLPKTVDGPYVWGYDGTTTAGYYITTSEMGYMYYENLGNYGFHYPDGSYPHLRYYIKNADVFINLQFIKYQETYPYEATEGIYWSGTETAYTSDPAAWFFNFWLGSQFIGSRDNFSYAWAVRDGDVDAVPIPGALWLLGSGLVGLIGIRRKIRL